MPEPGGEIPQPDKQDQKREHSDTNPLTDGLDVDVNTGVERATSTIDRRNKADPDYEQLKNDWLRELEWIDRQVEEGKYTNEQKNRFLASLFAEFQSRSERDPLTNLYNRKAFERQAHKAIAHAARRGEKITVVMLDLDHFKAVNDVHGHDTGDDVLREVARHLRASKRTDDIVGRWGGEEILLLLPSTDAEETEALVKRIMETMPRGIQGTQGLIDVTASMGFVSLVPPRSTDTINEETILASMVTAADTGVYQAKTLGRDRAVTPVEGGEYKQILPQRPQQPPGQV